MATVLLVHACAAGWKSAKSDMGSKLVYNHAFGAAISAHASSALLGLNSHCKATLHDLT